MQQQQFWLLSNCLSHRDRSTNNENDKSRLGGDENGLGFYKLMTGMSTRKRKYYPIVRDWIDAGTALDKFGGFKIRKKGKIHKTIRYFRRKQKRK